MSMALTIEYPMWRFLYWQKNAMLSYDQIDEAVRNREIIPDDEQVSDLMGEENE